MTSPREKKPRKRKTKSKGDGRSEIDPRLIPFAEAYGDILLDAVLADPRLAHIEAEIDAAEKARRIADRAASRKRRPPE